MKTTTIYKAKVSERNKELANLVRENLKKYKVVGIIDITGLPASQFQEIREKLRKRAKVLIVKKNIIKIVFNEASKEYKNLNELSEFTEGICGLIFTNENPFKIYKFLQKNKSEAPAKAGQKAPKDIWVKAGPTGFSPGPIIGELGKFKIKAGIEGGKVAIKEDSLVAKEGEVISQKLAEILTRLGIKPMEVGLNIKVMYEEGIIYKRKVLEIDEDYYLNSLINSIKESFALSIGLNYYNKDNIKYFISKSFNEGLGLAIGIEYISKDTLNKLIIKAQSHCFAVGKVLPEELLPNEIKLSKATTSYNSNNNEDSKENKENKKDKEDKNNETDAAAGLGSLFG